MILRRNPYAPFLDKLLKPARYIGGEQFQIIKNWDDCSCKVALCFPDTYEIGMSHLGMKILYEELNGEETILAERCFAPWIDAEKEIRQNNLKLVTLENFQPLCNFDVVGFSLQYEMSYTNILNMLDLGGIEIFQKDRMESDSFVIAGGPCATHPEPLAPFVDFFVIGDGEDLFKRVAIFIGNKRKTGTKRVEILNELKSWEGIYVPSLYQTEVCEKSGFEVVKDGTVRRFIVDNFKKYPFPTKSPIPHLTAIFDRYSVEISRGCTEGCRFCQAGMLYRPIREREPKQIISSILNGMKCGGFDDASLTCLSTTDYSAITPLLTELLDEFAKTNSTLGVSSLRAYGLDKRVLDKLGKLKSTSITLAPEAGTERMRSVINKNITESDLTTAAENLFSRGWKKMKLYFMIGLPTETDEDVLAIMQLAKDIRYLARRMKINNPGITAAVSSFVPKPHTPFQWEPMITLREIERKQELLWQEARNNKLQYKKHISKISHLEGIVARGDRKISGLIYQVWKRGGRFDGWTETFDYKLWAESMEMLSIDQSRYLSAIPLDGRLPWDHIWVGPTKEFLLKERAKAFNEVLSPPCGKPLGEKVHYTNVAKLKKEHEVNGKKLVCHNCGVNCDLKKMIAEREVFLESLGAINEVPYEPSVENVEGDVTPVERSKRGQNVGVTYRVNYSKVGSISLISNLDLQKVVARFFKRAKMDVLYSEGFNPHPLISFGSALTLGISSLSEYFDVRVPYHWNDLDAVLKLLQDNSEKGIILNNIEEITRKTPSIQTTSRFFKYFIPVNNEEMIDDSVKKILNSEKIELLSFSKKDQIEIRKDIRHLFESIEKSTMTASQEVQKLIDEVSPCLGKVGVTVIAKVLNGSSIRPIEIVKCLNDFGLDVEKPIKMEVLF